MKIEEVIGYLNQTAGKRFKATESHAEHIGARLEKHSVDDLKRVIDAKCNEWIGDSKMEMYLRPATLFNKSKFQDYFEQLEPVTNKKLSARQIEHREYILTPKWLEKRSAVIKRAGHHCEGCGVYLGEKGQVHHLTYDHWKQEFLFELVYLCADCHAKMHGVKR